MIALALLMLAIAGVLILTIVRELRVSDPAPCYVSTYRPARAALASRPWTRTDQHLRDRTECMLRRHGRLNWLAPAPAPVVIIGRPPVDPAWRVAA